MAITDTNTVITGTTATYTNTSTVSTADIYGIKIYHPESQIVIRNPMSMSVTQTRHRPTRNEVKDFWDGVEWEEYTSYIPRISITKRVIIGKMYKRWRTPAPMDRGKGLGIFKQFANHKELFEEKLKGNA